MKSSFHSLEVSLFLAKRLIRAATIRQTLVNLKNLLSPHDVNLVWLVAWPQQPVFRRLYLPGQEPLAILRKTDFTCLKEMDKANTITPTACSWAAEIVTRLAKIDPALGATTLVKPIRHQDECIALLGIGGHPSQGQDLQLIAELAADLLMRMHRYELAKTRLDIVTALAKNDANKAWALAQLDHRLCAWNPSALKMLRRLAYGTEEMLVKESIIPDVPEAVYLASSEQPRRVVIQDAFTILITPHFDPALLAPPLFQLEILDGTTPSKRTDFSLDHLSPSEREVFNLVAFGLSNREIARMRGVSISTVKNQISTIMAKLKRYKTRSQMIAAYFASGAKPTVPLTVPKHLLPAAHVPLPLHLLSGHKGTETLI